MLVIPRCDRCGEYDIELERVTRGSGLPDLCRSICLKCGRRRLIDSRHAIGAKRTVPQRQPKLVVDSPQLTLL